MKSEQEIKERIEILKDSLERYTNYKLRLSVETSIKELEWVLE